MANVIVESKGNVISFKDDITGIISLQVGDNIYEANYKGKNLKFNNNNLLFLGADNFLDSNNLIYKNTKNNIVYNYEFNDEWEYLKNWGSKKITKLKDTQESYYDYEEYYQEDFNDDGEYGLVYEDLEENGEITLKKNSLSNLYVNDSSSQWSITKKNGSYIKYKNGKYIAVAAEQNGEMNLLVQKHNSSKNLKIFYSDSGDWSFKNKDYYFEKTGTYEYYDAEILFGVDFDENDKVGYDLEIIEDKGSQSLKKDSYGNLYLVDSLVDDIYPLFYKNGQLKNNFLANKIPIAVEIIDDDPKIIWENNKNGDLILWTFDENYNFESTNLIKYQSSEYFETETLFSQDFDGDEETGFTFNNPFDENGSIYLVTDQLGHIYIQSIEGDQVVDIDPISLKGNQIDESFFNGFTILGAESFSDSNYLALENNNNGGIKIYSADEEWNLLKSSFIDLDSNDYFDAEDNFQQDFDGDGIVGYDFSIPFEDYGDIYLAKDQVDNIYVYDGKVTDSKKNPIFYKGYQLNDTTTFPPNSTIFENFDLVGAEKINQKNYAALESLFSGDLAIWNLSDNWNYITFEKVEYETNGYYLSETEFVQDFNGDEIIGFSYSNVETEGNVDLLLNDQFGEAYVSSTLENSPDIFAASASFEKEAITYKGLNVSESDEFSIFGDTLIAAETINNTNKVAWKKTDNDLTIWDMNTDWSFDSTLNVQFQTLEYFQYESQFNLDFDGDGTVGVASETVENDKFVELITDNIGSVIIKTSGNDQELFPTYNFEKINTNEFSELTLLAADTNLYKNKIVNQIAWAEKDEINNIVNIELWEMDNDWNFVSSETISKNLDDESINPEYQLQELTFDTDFDKDGDVGNGYFGFYLFSVQEDSPDLNGNTFLKLKTLDNTYIAENSETSWEIKINSQSLTDNFDFEGLDPFQSLMTKYELEAGDFGDITVLAAEQINGKNKVVVGNQSSIFVFGADLNWVIDSQDLDFYNTTFLTSNIGIQDSKFYDQELLFKQDFSGDGNIGIYKPLDFTLENNGFIHVYYDKNGNYDIQIPEWSPSSAIYLNASIFAEDPENELNFTNYPDINILSVEGLTDLNGNTDYYLLVEENEIIKLYSTNTFFYDIEDDDEQKGHFFFEDNDEDINQGLLWEESIQDFLLSDGLEGLEYLFKQDFDSNNVIGKYQYLDISGETALIKDTNNNLSILNLSDLGFDLDVGKNFGENFDASQLSLLEDPNESELSNKLIGLTKKNKQILDKVNFPWEFLSAETISDQNKILLKHKKKNTIKVWNFDENWNYKKSSKVIKQTEEIIDYENLFNYDINNDGIIGEKFEKLELNGDVQMLKDQGGFLYSKIDSEGNAQSITQKNKKVKFDNLGGYEVVCIDEISGNKVVTKHKKKNILKIWEADESWALNKSGKDISSKNDLFFEKEINFDTDFDEDGKVGFVYEDIDSDGLVMQKNQNGYASVIVDADNKYLTNKKGDKILYKKGSWELKSAEKVGDTNQIVFNHKKNKSIAIWSMDEDWKFSSIENKLKKSKELFFEKETVFGTDFDGDGDIGLIYTDIENQGLVLQKNQLGNVSIIDGINNIYLKNKKDKNVNFKSGKWELIGAQIIDDVNQAVWKNSGNGSLKLWTLDENWKYINQSKILSGSDSFNDLQVSFGQIF